jgi:hypothetical protein
VRQSLAQFHLTNGQDAVGIKGTGDLGRRTSRAAECRRHPGTKLRWANLSIFTQGRGANRAQLAQEICGTTHRLLPLAEDNARAGTGNGASTTSRLVSYLTESPPRALIIRS